MRSLLPLLLCLSLLACHKGPVDADADGYPEGVDCDDADPQVNPAVVEVCDGLDNDCDGTIDGPEATDAQTWYADADADGYGDARAVALGCTAPEGHVEDATDCDDGAATTWPGADELCDGDDNDCDGAVDEDSVDAPAWYLDADQDGFGDPLDAVVDCEQPEGRVADDSDCNDSLSIAHPGAVEICDEVDNDCDGTVDEDDAVDALTWYLDSDGDGYGDTLSTTTACELPSGYTEEAGDCDDTDATLNPDDTPGATEDCPSTSCADTIAVWTTATDGYYWIDPDRAGAFEVECEMSTDGGGWIVLSLSSAGADDVYRTNPDNSNDGTARSGDQAQYFQHITTTDGFTETEFLHNSHFTYPNLDIQDITYENPATGSDFDSAELDAIRSIITELSSTTRQVAGAVDDSGNAGGLGHEIYISNGSGSSYINLTYGSQTGNEQSCYYLYHTTTAETTTDNVSLAWGGTAIDHLDAEYILPSNIQLGWAASSNSQWGGGAYWGYEWDYILVR